MFLYLLVYNGYGQRDSSGLFVKNPTELFDADLDRLYHELRTVVALQKADM